MTIQQKLTDLDNPLEGGSQEEATTGSIKSRELNGDHTLSTGSLQEPMEDEERMEEIIKNLGKGFRKLKDENAQLRTSTQKLLAENTTLREAIQKEQKENAALQRALQKEEEERLATKRLLNKAQEQAEELRVADRQARTEVDALKRQLSSKELEIEAVKRELHGKYPELPKVAGPLQGYQAKVVIEDDVLLLITTLNTEIAELCIAIAHSESFAFARKPGMEDTTNERLAAFMNKYYDPRFSVMGWLYEQQCGRVDPLILEIALREALVAISSWIISERDPALEGIEPTEIQLTDNTGDPWGRLVHIIARELPCNTLRYTLRRSISVVLTLFVMAPTGCAADDTTCCEFSLKANEQLTKIIDLILQLSTIIGTGGTEELWIHRGVPGEEFDPDMMDDFEDLTEDDQIDGTILGTTALGLCRAVIYPDVYTAGLHLKPLLKPKVVRKSFLDNLQLEDEDSDETTSEVSNEYDTEDRADNDGDSLRSW